MGTKRISNEKVYIIKIAVDPIGCSFFKTLLHINCLVIECMIKSELVGQPFDLVITASKSDDFAALNLTKKN